MSFQDDFLEGGMNHDACLQKKIFILIWPPIHLKILSTLHVSGTVPGTGHKKIRLVISLDSLSSSMVE